MGICLGWSMKSLALMYLQKTVKQWREFDNSFKG